VSSWTPYEPTPLVEPPKSIAAAPRAFGVAPVSVPPAPTHESPGDEARRSVEPFSLVAPAGWASESALVLAGPANDRGTPNVVLAVEGREGANETLNELARRKLEELAQRLPEFLLLHSSVRTLADGAVVVHRFLWQSPRGPIEQSVAYAEAAGGERISITAAALPPPAAPWAAFDRVVSTLRARPR
jgi:hypothetical protein